MMLSLDHLRERLGGAWCAATSYDPRNWSAENAAYGHCAVTACIVQDDLGGDIVWALARLPDGEEVSHFFNRIDGVEVDLTRGQFPAGTMIPAGGAHPSGVDNRTYILCVPETQKRYEMLKARVDNTMKGAA